MNGLAYGLTSNPGREWMDAAACRDYDPEMWSTYGHTLTAANAEAIRLCHGCPVRSDCLDYALAGGEQHGIWGGHTATELRRIAADRRMAEAVLQS